MIAYEVVQCSDLSKEKNHGENDPQKSRRSPEIKFCRALKISSAPVKGYFDTRDKAVKKNEIKRGKWFLLFFTRVFVISDQILSAIYLRVVSASRRLGYICCG